MTRANPDITNFERDESTGLLLPRQSGSFTKSNGRGNGKCVDCEKPKDCLPAYADGVQNERTYLGALVLPRKYSLDADILSAAMVDADFADNEVGSSPFPELTGIVNKFIREAAIVELSVTGRLSPSRLVTDALSRANDTGLPNFLQRIVYGQCVYNRGTPITLAPFHYDISVWEDYGIHLEKAGNIYYCTVDWQKIGVPSPYAIDPLRFTPTDSTEYPYYFDAYYKEQKVSVLLHSSQVIPFVPGVDRHIGFGTSPTWGFITTISKYLIQRAAELERYSRANKGDLLLLPGAAPSDAQKVKDAMDKQHEDNKNRSEVHEGTPTIAAGGNLTAAAQLIKLRDTTGVDYKYLQELAIDQLALAFGVSTLDIAPRGGVGFGAQSEALQNSFAASGVNSILYALANKLSGIYDRVRVVVNSPNDPAQRLNLDGLVKFSAAITPLIGVGVLEAREARSIMDTTLVKIPELQEEVAQDDSGDDTQDSGLGKVIADLILCERAWRYEVEKIQPKGTPKRTEVTASEWEKQEFYDAFPELDGMLDSEVSKEKQEDRKRWEYVLVLLAFVKGSKKISDATRLRYRDQFANYIKGKYDSATEALAGGGTISDWQKSASIITRDSWGAQQSLGRGGINATNDVDEDWVQERLDAEIDTIDGIAERAKNGELTVAQILAYGGGLATAAMYAFQYGLKEAANDGGYKAVAWVRSANESCEDCIYFSGLGRVPITPWAFMIDGSEVYPRDGQTLCNIGCKCDLIYE